MIATSANPGIDLADLEAPDAAHAMSGQLPFGDPPQDGVLTDLEMPGYVSKDGPWFGSGHAPDCRWLRSEVGRGRPKHDGSGPILGKRRPMRRAVACYTTIWVAT